MGIRIESCWHAFAAFDMPYSFCQMPEQRCDHSCLRAFPPVSASRTSGREGSVEISTDVSRDQTMFNLNGFCDRRFECHSFSIALAANLDVAWLKQLSHFVDQLFVRERLADVAICSRWKWRVGSWSGSV